jgi:uncharacterized protein YjbI with pentapeptide repeats
MKISFSIGPRERNIPQPEPFDIPYNHTGHLCSVIVYGDINKPQVLIVPLKRLPSAPISRYWFFMNISWSKFDGFEFNQYSDPEIITYLNSTVLNSTIGILKGADKIQINNGLINLVFRAEVSHSDLEDNNHRMFIEKCSEFGIKIVDIEFAELHSLYKVNCHRCQLNNVKFINSDLEDADFTGSKLNNVKFVESNLKSANFTNSLFSKVEFSQVILRESIFDNCRVTYNKSKIENNETLIFNNHCDLTASKFVKAILCSKFECSNLSSANFSEAKLVACKFYDCTLHETIFTKSLFTAFGTQTSKSQKQITTVAELITCRISSGQEEIDVNRGVVNKGIISNCKFDSSSMRFVDLSNNLIVGTDFECADLSKAKLYNCEFVKTTFNGKKLKSANLQSADVSFSFFKDNCILNEVNLSYTRMIETKFNKSELVGASFYGANLISSQFIDSNLTGVDFRSADLTLVNFDRAKLNSANFFQTKRGGANFNITFCKRSPSDEIDDNTLIESSCIVECIEWSPKRNGEIQLDKMQFLSIVSGRKSPLAVIASLSKDNPSVISYIYNQAQAEANSNSKSAGNDMNDASINVNRDVNDSDLSGGSIETKPYGETDQEEESAESNDSLSNEFLEEEEEQG